MFLRKAEVPLTCCWLEVQRLWEKEREEARVEEGVL